MRCTNYIAIAIGAVCLSSCSRSPSSTVSFPARIAPPDPWRLTCLDPRLDTPALLWNGLIGIRIARDGTGFDTEGHPLPAFSIDSYDTSGEEKIQTVPNPLGVAWTVGDVRLSPKESTDYEQTVDMRTSVMTTSWTQQSVHVKSETLLDPLERAVFQRWTLTSPTTAPAAVTVGLAGESGEALSTSDGTSSWTVTRPLLTAADAARFEGPPSGVWTKQARGSAWGGTLTGGRPLVFERVVRFETKKASESIWNAPWRSIGQIPSTGLAFAEKKAEGGNPDFDAELRRSSAVWADRWKTDIEIDGPVADQQAIRSFLFYLRSGISRQSLMSIAPFGLSSDRYNGHIFWDADTWIFPVLALIDPETAARIPQYRINRLAVASYAATLANSTPRQAPSARFPWESSASGLEVAPGNFGRELHITGDVARCVDQAEDLGLIAPAVGDQLIVAAGRYWLKTMASRPDGTWGIAAVMSPDENHVGDNDLYTNLIAQWNVDRAREIDPSIPKRTLYLPRDENTFLSYDGDTVRGYKQPAAILSLYPLQFPPAEAVAKTMMDRFAGKAARHGPAMTDSVNALIWARLGETDKAYTAWCSAWQDFVRPPHLLFAEHRQGGQTYFATGAAMCLQSVVYGFLGFRLDSLAGHSAAWSINLRGNRQLSIQPNLPKAWQRVTFKNFCVQGRRYTVEATHSTCKVTRSDVETGSNH